MVVTSNLSVLAAAAAVAAAAAESVLAKLASRSLLVRTWSIGVICGSGPPGDAANAHTQVVCDRVQVEHSGFKLDGAESRLAWHGVLHGVLTSRKYTLGASAILSAC